MISFPNFCFFRERNLIFNLLLLFSLFSPNLIYVNYIQFPFTAFNLRLLKFIFTVFSRACNICAPMNRLSWKLWVWLHRENRWNFLAKTLEMEIQVCPYNMDFVPIQIQVLPLLHIQTVLEIFITIRERLIQLNEELQIHRKPTLIKLHPIT